jgi:Mlc titration factor MtfA (ptsG expression regulator)
MLIPALIIIPCAILTALLGVLSLYGYLIGFQWIILIPLGIGTGTFIIRKAIHEWWIAKHPVGLSAKEIHILSSHFTYYQNLGNEHKLAFEQRLSVFRDQKKFQMRGMEKVPGDIHLLVSATAIQMTFGLAYKKEFFPRLGAVILFPKTFITPELSYQLHAVEVNTDQYDCLLLALNMLVKGLKSPKQYYNATLYGMAKLFKKENGIQDEDLPLEKEFVLETLFRIRNFNPGYIFQYTALQDYEIFEMCTEHFFSLPQSLQDELPEIYEFLVQTFNQDPLQFNNPPIISLGEAISSSDE